MTVQLFHGDCLEVMPTLEAQSFDAIIADLPYGTTACKWDVVIPFEPLWREYKRLIKPRGAIVLFGSQPFTSLLVTSNLAWFKYEWVWEKDKAANILNARRQPLKVQENICVFGDGQVTYNPQMISCKPYRHKNRSVESDNFGKNIKGYDPNGYTEYDKAFPRAILQFSKYGGNRGSVHPTQKPVALLEYLIRTYTNEGDAVLDNTMGSGTTGVACQQTGRNFVGIEKDAGYFEIAKRRIETAQPALLATG